VAQIEDVDYSVISLQNKHFDILQNCFQANKPAYLTAPPNRTHDQKDEGGNENPKGGKKKPEILKEEKEKFPYKDLGLMIRITAQVQDWKITGFKYKQIFTKKIVSSTPSFHATGMTACNKWHIKGFCYKSKKSLTIRADRGRVSCRL
jgi:hypothetical protein